MAGNFGLAAAEADATRLPVVEGFAARLDGKNAGAAEEVRGKLKDLFGGDWETEVRGPWVNALPESGTVPLAQAWEAAGEVAKLRGVTQCEPLLLVRVPSPVESYAEFVVANRMRDAVYDRVLTGDTYFTQFRGLHQIPETLGEEVNDRIEEAIRDIRARSLRSAFEHLRCANLLTDGMLAAIAPMADNLATADYHEIRENLGLTSGSHSVCLRFHMFSDLYKQLWDAIEFQLTCAAGSRDPSVDAASRAVQARRFDDPDTWLLHLLLGECLTFRTFVNQWREQHLHLPRNNLGGGHTKSLTGSPDAILAVKRMRNAAYAADVMQPLVHVRGLSLGGADTTRPLAGYLASDASLDSQLLLATGRVTQHRFQQVQQRLGFFAQKCPFTPPPPRRA